ncbi:MAG: PH domain-containing protein [Gemmatimonadaceae bacterium]
MNTITTAEQSADQDGVLLPNIAGPIQAESSVADGVEHSLDPRLIMVERIAGWIGTVVASFGVLVALVLVLFLAPIPGWLSALGFVLWVSGTVTLGWFSHRWPEREYRHASYKVDEQGIEIHKGVLWRKVIKVPRSRVQHTDVSQGPLERRYGLGTLAIYTAGTDYAKVDLPGLTHETALRIRDHLLPRESGDAV